ncbi:hypothetical protein G7Z17_g6207 [Cylindrodendrum hubeiense]|uniref:Uncharacterized protein n=1 Tax=Cylindrodendrum hubeiense TaxID=595255 RepID=A0A9P5H5R2_9HYPO|nr:hypothetical protein G7Z17_g6207 [Cylindrodendrum hubeiense]
MASNRILKHFNATLALSFAVVAVSTFNYGFDNSGYATTQAMDAFQRQFGELDSTGEYTLPPMWLSLFNSLNYIGFGAGVIIGSLVSARWGRRWYIYIGMELAVVPVYQAEIMPAEIRGFAVGSYQFSLMSPRWLLTKDRSEEAHQSLKKLRAGTITDAEIDEQFAALQYALKQDVEEGAFTEIFQGVNLKRTAIVVVMNFFQQATGQAFASTYGTIFIRGIGTVNPFTMTIINSVVNLSMVFIGLYLNDRLGRR